MSESQFEVVQLAAEHVRGDFSCEVEPLDRYFKSQVTQDIRRRVTVCFVAMTAVRRVAGYYTLAAGSVLLNELPEAIRKRLPKYPSVPVVRMGRLAVDRDFKGRGLGAALLADGLARAAHADIGAYALLVDAKDEVAASFYLRHGFIRFPSTPSSLFLPLASVPPLSDNDVPMRKGSPLNPP